MQGIFPRGTIVALLIIRTNPLSYHNINKDYFKPKSGTFIHTNSKMFHVEHGNNHSKRG